MAGALRNDTADCQSGPILFYRVCAVVVSDDDDVDADDDDDGDVVVAIAVAVVVLVVGVDDGMSKKMHDIPYCK